MQRLLSFVGVLLFLFVSLVPAVHAQERRDGTTGDLPHVLPPAPFQGKVIVPRPERQPRPKVSDINVEFVPTGETIFNGQYSCDSWPAEAQIAFQRATTTWAQTIDTEVPLTVRACWTSQLGANVLGAAGPFTYFANFQGAPQQETWYPIGLANALAGEDLNGQDPEIFALFSASRNDWYFDEDPNGLQPNELDFETVILHEIGHGLGFTGSGSYGQDGCGQADAGCYGLQSSNGDLFPVIYDLFVEDGPGSPMLSYANPSQELGNLFTGGAPSGGAGGIYFNDTPVNAEVGAPAKLYTPSSWSGGSSYSHWDQQTFITTLMKPALPAGQAIRDPGLSAALMESIGWLRFNPEVFNLALASAPAEGDATLSWEVGDNAQIQEYYVDVRYFDEAYRQVKVIDGSNTAGGTLQTTIEDLGLGQHTFRLRWKRSDGTEGSSSTEPSVTFQLTTFEVAAEASTDDPLNRGRLTANWSVPPGTDLRDYVYEVSYRSGLTRPFQTIRTTTETQATLENLFPGRYTVRVRMIDEVSGTTYTLQQEASANVEFSGDVAITDVYPNPTSQRIHFNVTTRTAQQGNIVVYNTLGQRVYEATRDFGRQTPESVDIPVGGWGSGVYFVRVSSDVFQRTFKVAVVN
ncbi:T9SS type A sorting domain-containing protein [Salisaeta longa]|uniref:T9SS type A sorting domain-containing protein n=1 Tax=Salisaeta longa TaxID=503170 RepID=UPI0003B55B98|nr:T9SS type A sorting domain-containing protein [Salisaeta longa]